MEQMSKVYHQFSLKTQFPIKNPSSSSLAKFSTSHILLCIASSEDEKPKLDDSCVPNSTISKNDNLVSHGDHLKSESDETIKEEAVKTQPIKLSKASTKSSRYTFMASEILVGTIG